MSRSGNNVLNDGFGINRKIAELEREFVLVKKKVDDNIPPFNIKNKFDSQAHNISLCFKNKDVIQLKNDIRDVIMTELVNLGIIDLEEVYPQKPIEEEEEEDTETNSDL
jgi:hypothetical protein